MSAGPRGRAAGREPRGRELPGPAGRGRDSPPEVAVAVVDERGHAAPDAPRTRGHDTPDVPPPHGQDQQGRVRRTGDLVVWRPAHAPAALGSPVARSEECWASGVQVREQRQVPQDPVRASLSATSKTLMLAYWPTRRTRRPPGRVVRDRTPRGERRRALAGP
ncbi:hypothetical protein [Streptomyces hygroscopicus]|uniref:hypothetical protein n=1 Tax=Streptomyces hygroscopicus TaxID=1912 RepID=UPI0036B5FAC8